MVPEASRGVAKQLLCGAVLTCLEKLAGDRVLLISREATGAGATAAMNRHRSGGKLISPRFLSVFSMFGELDDVYTIKQRSSSRRTPALVWFVRRAAYGLKAFPRVPECR